jgi:uncharacterized membrane protein YhiD involved in acid resistance
MSDLFLHLLLALVMGATVGLERESGHPSDPHVGGIRTFALISLIGRTGRHLSPARLFAG